MDAVNRQSIKPESIKARRDEKKEEKKMKNAAKSPVQRDFMKCSAMNSQNPHTHTVQVLTPYIYRLLYTQGESQSCSHKIDFYIFPLHSAVKQSVYVRWAYICVCVPSLFALYRHCVCTTHTYVESTLHLSIMNFLWIGFSCLSWTRIRTRDFKRSVLSYAALQFRWWFS